MNIVGAIGVIAVRKRYTSEVCDKVEAREGDLDEGVGAHGKGNLTKPGHGGDHAVDGLVQLAGDSRRTRSVTEPKEAFLNFSQRKRVGGEGAEFPPG